MYLEGIGRQIPYAPPPSLPLVLVENATIKPHAWAGPEISKGGIVGFFKNRCSQQRIQNSFWLNEFLVVKHGCLYPHKKEMGVCL